MRKSEAFSLLEAMVTMSLLFLVLGLANDLFTQYSRILKFSASKTSSLSSMQVALQQIVDDARQAQSIITPNSVGATTPELRFVKVDPGNLTWLNNATVVTAGWVPSLTVDTKPLFIEVRYHLSDGSTHPTGMLLRDVGPPGGPVSHSWVIAENLAGLQFKGVTSWSGPGVNAVDVEMSLRESSHISVIRSSSMRPRI